MKSNSKEKYKGQRGKEKYELFKRFRHRAIEDIYKNKFFALFEHKCFKCGIKEKPHPEYGYLPIPLISPPDSEGKRHAIPKDVATLFRIMSPLRGRSEATLVFGCLS
jgi:hypothetical protein